MPGTELGIAENKVSASRTLYFRCSREKEEKKRQKEKNYLILIFCRITNKYTFTQGNTAIPIKMLYWQLYFSIFIPQIFSLLLKPKICAHASSLQCWV